MRVMVTGGRGVNGCWVTRELLELGHEPVVFDNRADFTLLRDVADDFEFIEGDITSLDQLTYVCEAHRVERVCHLAAVYPDASDADPVRGFTVNALATVYVLAAAHRAGVDRVVFTSSLGALSDMTEKHLEPWLLPVDETFPAYPTSYGVYGASKVASELMGIQYHQLFGIQFAALRYAAIYGMGKHTARHGSHNVIWAEMVENAMAGRPTVVAEGGDQRLDLVYTRDVARSVVLACTVEELSSHVFHIGSGCTYTLHDFADGVRASFPGAAIEIGAGLDPRDLGPGGYFRMDITRAREELGYEPRYDPTAAVRDWMEWTDKLELRPWTSSRVRDSKPG